MQSRITTACLAAIVIAAATPVRAQTLPFYDVDAQVAKCMAEVPKNSEEWVKKNAEWLKKNNEKGHDPAKSSAELFTMICNDLRIKERRNRDELAREWNSYDPRIRMQCISAPQVVDTASMKECLGRKK